MKFYMDADAREHMAQEGRELIPRRLLQAMGALILGCVLLVSIAVLTDRPKVGQPKASTVVAERTFVLSGHANAIAVTALDGSEIFAAENGGFMSAIRSALAHQRSRHRITDNPPVTLKHYENGRLQITDPSTGWQAELTMFGSVNTERWMALLDQ